MAARRPIFNVILNDKSEDHQYYWTKDIRNSIAEYLGRWFTEICGYSTAFKGATVDCWWSSNKLLVEDDELVVYFLPRRQKSIIVEVTGQTPTKDGAGATLLSDQGVISEVFIESSAGDNSLAKLLAICAFHELMHNKLDADPKHTVTDVHKLGGAAGANFGNGDVPTDAHKRLMGKHLGTAIPQYTGHLFKPLRGKIQA